jgi:2'-hydroxyisoflavone reductase
MRLLVLGGTAFLGRHLVEAALERGHRVTLFTRGRTNPGLFPQVDHLIGDRDSDLSALSGREFDVAVDTSGYLPKVVRASAELLAGSVESYVFVSTISVYRDAGMLTEETPLQVTADPACEDVGTHYGALKALCEEAVQSSLPGRSIVIRPGLVVGPHDYTGRFSYWPRRVAEGGEVLAPGRPEARVWLIDARDLAEWTIRLAEARTSGTYNAAGPPAALTLGDLLDECRAITGSDAHFTWVEDSFLLEHEVAPYTELPLWLPDAAGGYPAIDFARATAAGLTHRPIGDTIRAVLDDAGADAAAMAFGLPRRPAGLDPRRERGLLADWHAARIA